MHIYLNKLDYKSLIIIETLSYVVIIVKLLGNFWEYRVSGETLGHI